MVVAPNSARGSLASRDRSRASSGPDTVDVGERTDRFPPELIQSEDRAGRARRYTDVPAIETTAAMRLVLRVGCDSETFPLAAQHLAVVSRSVARR
jgi:hypothetical protein